MPAGAIPYGEQLEPVNDVVNVYDETHPHATHDGQGSALAYVNVARVHTDTPEREIEGYAGHLLTHVDTEERIAQLFAGANPDGGSIPTWSEASRGERGGSLGGDYRVNLGDAEPAPNAPIDGGAGGVVEGVLGLAGYYLRSHRQGSYAEMDAATGWMRAHRFGLVSDVGSRGLRSVVNGRGAAAKAALTVEGLQINLNDLFPNENVNLPLGLSLDLAQSVALPGGRTAEQAFQRVLEAERRIDAMARLMRELDSVYADIEPLLATMPGYDAAKKTVEDLEGELFNAKDEAERTAAELVQKLAEIEQANAAVERANAMWSAAMQDLEMVRDHIELLEAEITWVESEIERVEDEKELLGTNPPVQPPIGVNLQSTRRAGRVRMRIAVAMSDPEAELEELRERLGLLQQDLGNSQVAKQLLGSMTIDLGNQVDLAELAASTADTEAIAAEIANEEANARVDELQAELGDGQAALDAFYDEAAQTDDRLNERIDHIQELSTELEPVVAEVRSAALDLAALLPIYHGITEALRPWPIFKIDAITYELDTQVTDSKVVTKVRCGLEGVTLLGTDLSLNTCEDLRGERAWIESQIENFLAKFALNPPEVRLDLPTADVDVYPVIDGRKQALSTLTGLRLRIAPFEIKQLTTPVVEQINALIDEIQVSRSMDEVREIVDLQGPALPQTPWDLSWLNLERPPTDQAYAAPTSSRMRIMANNAEAEQDADEELDDFQNVLEETNGDETIGGQGTSGLDAQVGELGTNVTWAGCTDCDTCVVGTPGCDGDPCYVDPALCDEECVLGDPDCHEDDDDECERGEPDCPLEICDPLDELCEQECLPGVPCKIGEPCLPYVPGCVDGRWRGGLGKGLSGAGDDVDSRGGTGRGSDGVPIGDVVGDANLPHTGGRPALLLAGIVLLMAAGLLRRRPAEQA